MKWILAVILRGLLLGLLWAAFSGADPQYVLYGAVSVSCSVALSLALLPPQGSPRPSRWPRRLWFSLVLSLWFLGQSVVGGVDVARRALRRRPDIDPTVIPAPVHLPEGHARQLAMVLMNLLPGSMIQRSIPGEDPHGEPTREAHRGDTVELHTLSAALDPARQWSRLQHRVAQAAR
ncbi:Na+/H+ antiporter subunit E [Nesterenkonia lacusekhoensis]|uniref:Multicomponent Na+:H+ antiporter subunit E n=1 Tax=Nesterenkonia lacusekhoensis TaxID=150832 RepID=A0ABS4T4C4_9MICC|nr:multicomponent Na+:H+ antiporter subunit E [Nesterenkonia lacusekhoensis]